ncbi:diguanylate cyclase [Neptuniibacter marinus]|uniref:GGDEF domain-containing protein n=1 Tax=Neptuniibacter marinus TaxID=1806670 RepID=UPI003B5AAD30
MDDTKLHQLLRDNNKALLLVIDALPFPIYYKDIHGRYLGCNKAYTEYAGVEREVIIGKTAYQLFAPEVADVFTILDKQLINEPGVQINETPIHRSDKDSSYVKLHKATFCDETGAVAGLIGAIIDITEQKNLENKFQRLASYDDLTSIYNRREGTKQLINLCTDAIRKKRPLSLIILDLDNFKSINDTYGHGSGDVVLKMAAQTLEHNSRTSDIICRYGGEEFLIILPETTAAGAINIAERYRLLLEQLNVQITSSDSLTITASMGIGELDLNFPDQELMLKQADKALYKAKENGKNQVCY